MPEIKVIEVIEPPVSVKLTNGVKGDQGKSIVSASFVDNDIVFVNDENEEIVIEGGKTALQGSNAYQVWVEQGNEGTVEDYLASLIGPQGVQGIQGEQGIQGIQGEQGIQGIQGIQGLKGNQWRGAYNASTQYVVDDVVSYNGSSYICILASLGNLPSNTTYWSLFAQAGEVTTAAMNTALANKADKLFATNLVTNGDFSNGITGWNTNGVLSAISNTLSITGNGSSSFPNAYQDTNVPCVAGHKFYARAKLKVTNALATLLSLQIHGSTGGNGLDTLQSTPTINTQYSLSNVFTLTNQTGFVRVKPYSAYVDAATANGKVLEVQNVLVINLTALFGLGKEPTKEQMDWLLAQKFTNSWFNGTAELTSIIDLLTLANNTKADKTQEAWITPTLQNGATQADATSYPVGYFKDTLGIVHMRGKITCPTGGSVISMTFPVGYRPIKRILLGALNSATIAMSAIVIIENGGTYIGKGSTSETISLDGLTFKAEQ